MRELVGLAEREEAFARLGVSVYAISTEEPGTLRDLQAELGDAVTLVSDPSGKAIEAFGLVDEKTMPQRRLARAATLHVDHEGIVKRRWIADNYRKRPEAEEVLEALAASG